MSTERQAWDFFQAVEASRKGKEGQAAAEAAREQAAEEYAAAERAYRRALALKIIELRAADWPATVCADLARGDEHVANLRYSRDVAEGVKDAIEQRAWRHTADRRDVTQLIEWSRIVAPLGEQREPNHLPEPIGTRRAA